MWKLKNRVEIVIKKEGAIINEKTLEQNPDLALMVMNNPEYKDKWGHNFTEVNATRPSRERTPEQKIIPVDIKKKVELLSPTSGDSASTSTEAYSDGMALNLNDQKPQSPLSGSQQSKPVTERTGSPVKK